MSARILSGTVIAAGIMVDLKMRVAKLKDRKVTPGLVIIRVGNDPASISYVNQKDKVAGELGIHSKVFLKEDDEFIEATLLQLIATLNDNSLCHGILVQLPLPKHVDVHRIMRAIVPWKDVDCFHPENQGRFLAGGAYLLPCTPHAVLQILSRSHIATEGKHVVICGRSNLVGSPLASLMAQKTDSGNATVTLCHSLTPDLAYFTRQAEIVVAAMGRPRTITAAMVKPGAVVVDVGVNRVESS